MPCGQTQDMLMGLLPVAQGSLDRLPTGGRRALACDEPTTADSMPPYAASPRTGTISMAVSAG